MMMRLDEISENYNNLKVKVVSDTTNKTEQTRGGLGICQRRRENDDRHGKERFMQLWRTQGGISHQSVDGK